MPVQSVMFAGTGLSHLVAIERDLPNEDAVEVTRGHSRFHIHGSRHHKLCYAVHGNWVCRAEFWHILDLEKALGGFGLLP